MGTATIVVLALTAVGVTFIGWLMRGYLRQRGDRLITCPENHEAASVKVDAGHAAVTGLMGHTELRLSDCSRWPERQGCGQECLTQIAQAPDGCLIRSRVAQWYAEKTCALCHRPVGEREWMEHEPALIALQDPEHKTIAWRDVAPETMWTVFETHAPVCWNCHVTETFRRQHPELVIDRPA
jgi:hypothetical protein